MGIQTSETINCKICVNKSFFYIYEKVNRSNYSRDLLEKQHMVFEAYC